MLDIWMIVLPYYLIGEHYMYKKVMKRVDERNIDIMICSK